MKRLRAGLAPAPGVTDDQLDAELAKLSPPRKYYQNYQRTRGANDDMLHAPQGLHAFFRAYYFYKSADYKGNNPHPLKARTAAGRLPRLAMSSITGREAHR